MLFWDHFLPLIIGGAPHAPKVGIYFSTAHGWVDCGADGPEIYDLPKHSSHIAAPRAGGTGTKS